MSDLLPFPPPPDAELADCYRIPLVDRPAWYFDLAEELYYNAPQDHKVAAGMVCRLSIEMHVRALCRHSCRPIGQLIERLRKQNILDAEGLRDLRACWRIGNRLVHGYRTKFDRIALLMVGTAGFISETKGGPR